MLSSLEPLEQYLVELASSSRRALFLFFPNFEERSVTAAEVVVKHPQIGKHTRAMIFWFQGRHRPEILDEIKTANGQRVKALCHKVWPDAVATELAYPEPEIRRFQQAVREQLETMGPETDIVVDISATPRDVLFQLFDFLFPKDQWPHQIENTNTRVRALRFVYTWAQTYPSVEGQDLLGDLIGHHTGKPLSELLRNSDNARLVVCGAGTGHDALQAISIAKGAVQNANLRTDVFLLLHRANPSRSFKKMVGQQAILRHLRSHQASFRSVFSVEHFASELMSVAVSADEQRADRFIIGPFGPKPFGLCAYFAAREYRRRVRARGGVGDADILNPSAGQYLTIYSIGAGRTELFSITGAQPGTGFGSLTTQSVD